MLPESRALKAAEADTVRGLRNGLRQVWQHLKLLHNFVEGSGAARRPSPGPYGLTAGKTARLAGSLD